MITRKFRFGDPAAIAAIKAKPQLVRIDAMHAAYGATPGHRCGECAELVRFHQAATWFKCAVYGLDNGPAGDWRKFWPACGRFRSCPTPSRPLFAGLVAWPHDHCSPAIRAAPPYI